MNVLERDFCVLLVNANFDSIFVQCNYFKLDDNHLTKAYIEHYRAIFQK